MNVPEGAKIYVACGYTDMRKQIDGLAQLVEQNFHLSPFENAFFLFCGRRRDRLKALYWEGDGFLLLYKRLDSNSSYQWPRSAEEVQEITQQQYRWLMEGLQIDPKKAIGKSAAGRIL
jgi:transposase